MATIPGMRGAEGGRVAEGCVMMATVALKSGTAAMSTGPPEAERR